MNSFILSVIKESEMVSAVRRRKSSVTAQAVSRWLPTAAARVPPQVSSCWICAGAGVNLHSTNCSTLIIIYHPGLVQ
jgi:hypothetical protein